jgi:glycosyltransferase involved in cell wall biosynthesis
MKRLRWPYSLEGTLRRINAKILFPVHGSLGQHFTVPWIGWIPDFQHKHLPQLFPAAERQNRDLRFGQLVRDAAHLVVSSNDAYNDLMRWFPIPSARTSVLPFVTAPMDSWYEADPALVARQFQLPEKFLIFPSQFWMHKNHGTLISAIALLRNRGLADICLVSTGHTNDFRNPEYFPQLARTIEEASLSSHIRILGLLPRHLQVQLIRRAVAIVQPSLFEGWSSLLEDARALGKRVYVSDLPVHREQNPPNCAFFNPRDAVELADLIQAEWQHLRPGPDGAAEKNARELQHERTLDYARKFITVVDRAVKVPWEPHLPGPLVTRIVKRGIKHTLRTIRPGLVEQISGQRQFDRLCRKPPELMWRTCPSARERRVESACAQFGRRLFVVAGYHTLDQVLSKIDIFDLESRRWKERLPMPNDVPQTHLGVTCDGKRFIYLVGGQLGPQCHPCVATCFVFDTQARTWRSLPSLPRARYSPALKLWRGRLHAFSGSEPDRVTAAREHWSLAVEHGRPIEDSWRDEPPIPRGGPHRATAIIGDKLFAFGGQEGDVPPFEGDTCFKCNFDGPAETVYCDSYCLEAGSSDWKTIAPIPTPATHCEHTPTVGPYAILAGGMRGRGDFHDRVQVYDSRVDRWCLAGRLPYNMKTLAAYYEGTLFTFAGQRTISAENHAPGEILQNVWRASFDTTTFF